MSEKIFDEIPGEAAQAPPEAASAKKTLAPGFKRNMLIIGGALAVAFIGILVLVYLAKGKSDAAAGRVAPTVISTGAVVGGSKASDMTPADESRLGRVQSSQSATALEEKKTFIPAGMPMRLEPPIVPASGPGKGYLLTQGDAVPTPQQTPVDSARDSRIQKGIEVQLLALADRGQAPGVQTAAAYVQPSTGKQGDPAAAQAASQSSSITTSAKASPADVLVRGLSISGARLASPLDTSKSDFVSAEISSGPLAGAYLLGKGKWAGENGIQMTFTRMSFEGEDYPVNVTGLDNQTSSDAMAADIDRKIFARHVMPVIFATAQAYTLAIAKPAQSVVAAAGAGTTEVVTASATARQATAAGVGAGLGKLAESMAQTPITAYMPRDTSIGLLFLDPIFKKVK